MLKALFLLLKSGMLGKVLMSGGTMLLSVAIYAQMYGWRYAAGLVGLIFVHEMGHYLAARQRGLKVGAPTFIPFVGAWIEMKNKPHNVETEAYVGLAGPLVGTLGALACYYFARETDDRLLLSIAYSGFMINLFNLIPVSPLDGGRITAVLSPRIWLAGAPMLMAMFFYRPSPLLILLGLAAIPQLRAAWRYDPKAPENAAYYGISAEDRLTYAGFYLALVVFLSMMSYDLHMLLTGKV
jgi:Zn-dependent protease